MTFPGADHVSAGCHQDPRGGAESRRDATRAPRHRVPRCACHIYTYTGITHELSTLFYKKGSVYLKQNSTIFENKMRRLFNINST